MLSGMKKLAVLVDVDYFDLLPQVFGDEEATKNEDGQRIVKEVSEIYEKGELIFAEFQKLSDDLAEK